MATAGRSLYDSRGREGNLSLVQVYCGSTSMGSRLVPVWNECDADGVVPSCQSWAEIEGRPSERRSRLPEGTASRPRLFLGGA
jgi:hypothetical protein